MSPVGVDRFIVVGGFKDHDILTPEALRIKEILAVTNGEVSEKPARGYLTARGDITKFVLAMRGVDIDVVVAEVSLRREHSYITFFILTSKKFTANVEPLVDNDKWQDRVDTVMQRDLNEVWAFLNQKTRVNS